MKKFIIPIIIGLLAVVSCSKEQAAESTAPYEEAELVSVMINSELPVDILTRAATAPNSAMGGFENVDVDIYDIRYQIQILDASGTDVAGTVLSGSSKIVKPIDTNAKSVSYSARLSVGKTYKFVIWADFVKKVDNGADLHYVTTAGLNDISLKSNQYHKNDDSRDAFSCAVDQKITASSSVNMTLKRPLGKVRFIMTDFTPGDLTDIESGLKFNYLVAGTDSVKVYTKFNAFDSTVSSPMMAVISDLGFESHAPQILPMGVAGQANQQVLFWDYLFAGSGGENVPVSFELEPTNDFAGDPIRVITTPSKAITVARNKLTTITANIMSANIDITVDVDDTFD